ncbi:MAG: hypothetical protein ACHQHP_03860 [Bacteroidia bacterium]
MKKTVFFLSAIILSSIAFEGCFKKGPDDPFISLHTRKGRVVGDWTVSSGSGTQVNASTTTWTYSNPSLTSTTGSTVSTQNIVFKYSFKSDGTWSSTQTTTGTKFGQTYTDVVTESGNWDFGGGIGSIKKKTELILSKLSSTDVQTIGSATPSTTTNTYGGQDNVSIFDIDELKNKEMILKWNNSNGSGSSINSDSGQYTLTQ